ncbi:hypothetical protein Tdes44962_MAKER09776 [Teratosphaeria destructans]|uniref:Uncharacterized protein n=1 Tax=Teratosphaeria destructans TaxID=418781 RepID=A0A9W7W1X7_9PEZI|nr:hypothetical protein Tdes44962_MAKER09776 [Teratosphaeria destructans]
MPRLASPDRHNTAHGNTHPSTELIADKGRITWAHTRCGPSTSTWSGRVGYGPGTLGPPSISPAPTSMSAMSVNVVLFGMSSVVCNWRIGGRLTDEK